MLFADEKNRLLELVINHRIKRGEFVTFAQEQGIAAPKDLLRRWCDRFYDTDSSFVYSSEPRLVNHFCIGADPEFAFAARTPNPELRYKHASGFGMTTVEAFGCDMTGRQAELRAFPSRSVLEVVASILDTLRHMTIAYPATLHVDWLAPAIIQQDGCGGHVHVGRKRPDVKQVLASLDKLTDLLIRAGVVDKEGSSLRKASTKYGKNSDFRVQPHGFEYRTMPTWLDGPWSAFLTLTLSKLCIFHKLNETMSPDIHTQTASKQTIENLLRTYSSIDDDARIALIGLNNFGLPKYGSEDFKVRWGIPAPTKAVKPNDPDFSIISRAKFYYPPVISPSQDTCKELFNYFVHNKPIPNRDPKPNWAPYKLEENVFKINYEAHRPGLPEISMGLLSKGLNVHIQGAAPGIRNVAITHPEALHIDVIALREYCQRVGLGIPKLSSESSIKYLAIYIPGNIALDYVVDKDMVSAYRNLIVKSGLFPIAKAEAIDSVDLSKFFGVKKKPQPLIGSVIRDMEGDKLIKDPLLGGKGKLFKSIYAPNPQHWHVNPAPGLEAGQIQVLGQALAQAPQQLPPEVFEPWIDDEIGFIEDQ